MTWRTRAISPGDIPALAELECRVRSLAPSERRSSDHLAFILSHDAGCSRVATIGDLPVGFCLCLKTGLLGFIGAIGVVPDARGQGIGGALLDECVDALAAHCEVIGTQCLAAEDALLAQFVAHDFQLVEPQLVLAHGVDTLSAVDTLEAQRVALPLQDALEAGAFARSLQERSLGAVCTLGAPGEKSLRGVLALELAQRRGTAAPATAAVVAGCVQRDLGADQLRQLISLAASTAGNESRTTLFLALNSFYHREVRALLASGWSLRRVAFRLVYAAHTARYRQLLSLPQVDLSHWTV